MWRQDIAEEKQAQPQMARGCLCLSINAKQTTSLGKEDISLFISLLSFFSWAYINFESREEAEGVQKNESKRQRKTQTGRKRKEKKAR